MHRVAGQQHGQRRNAVFLTANHCLGNPNTWTYYFNHESSTCSGSTGPTNNSISGGALLVADGGADVALIELSSTPPSSGTWNTPVGTLRRHARQRHGIHHPSGDVKKICFEEDSPYTSSTGGAAVWWIDAWELGCHRTRLFGVARCLTKTTESLASCTAGLRLALEASTIGLRLLRPVRRQLGILGSASTSTRQILAPPSWTVPHGIQHRRGVHRPHGVQLQPAGHHRRRSCARTTRAACAAATTVLVEAAPTRRRAITTPVRWWTTGHVLSGVALTFTLLTDNYPGETTWTLTDDRCHS